MHIKFFLSLCIFFFLLLLPVLAMSRARADVYFAPDPTDQIKALAAGMAEVRTLYAYDAGSTPV